MNYYMMERTHVQRSPCSEGGHKGSTGKIDEVFSQYQLAAVNVTTKGGVKEGK